MTDLDTYRETLRKMEKEANSGCGLVYEVFQSRLQGMIDAYAAKIAPEESARFIELATTESDYQTEPHRPEWDEGTCQHGLDAQTCPVGCFEFD